MLLSQVDLAVMKRVTVISRTIFIHKIHLIHIYTLTTYTLAVFGCSISEVCTVRLNDLHSSARLHVENSLIVHFLSGSCIQTGFEIL